MYAKRKFYCEDFAFKAGSFPTRDTLYFNFSNFKVIHIDIKSQSRDAAPYEVCFGLQSVEC